MSWLTLLVALLLSAAALAYVLWPLLRREAPPMLLENDRLTELMGRKDAVLRAIKDLEFDYQVGKVSEEDFHRFNQELRRQAIRLIQQIEQEAPQVTSLDERLEAEIARLRRTRADEASAPATISARYCTHCGHPLEADHRFCAHCGQPAALPETVHPG